MAVTTWTFTSGFEGWTFSDVSTANASATRSHVSGAIRTNLILDAVGGAKTAEGHHDSPHSLGVDITNGDTIALDYGGSSDGKIVRIRLRAYYTDATSEEVTVVNIGAGTLTLTMTQAKELDYVFVLLLIGAAGLDPRNTNRDLLEVRLTTVNPLPVPLAGSGEKLLGLDVDTETGAKRWATFWDGGLKIREYNNALAVQSTYSLVASGVAIYELDDRTYWVSPFAPAFFGTASLADIVYVYGRWDDGAVQHLHKSTDGASSFSDIGDSATWGAGWVGGFMAVDASTLFALVNDGVSSALYRTTDAGLNWSNLSTLPFEVDPGNVSGHPDGRILISSRDAGAQMVAYALSPDYSSWINATGSPAFPIAGGGSHTVVWVV